MFGIFVQLNVSIECVITCFASVIMLKSHKNKIETNFHELFKMLIYNMLFVCACSV